MQRSLNGTIQNELANIVRNHLNAMSEYLPISLESANPPADILACLERLLEICQLSSDELSYEVMEDAYTCQTKVEDFLRLMNQRADPTFDQSEISRVLKQISAIRQSAVGQKPPLPISQVWDILTPVKPDHLEVLGNGLYEARWWSPIPWMDVYLLRHTEGVMVYDEKQNPKALPEGLCVQFALLPTCSTQDEDS